MATGSGINAAASALTGAAGVATAPAGYAGAAVPTAPAPASSGVCLQFNPSGACIQSR